MSKFEAFLLSCFLIILFSCISLFIFSWFISMWWLRVWIFLLDSVVQIHDVFVVSMKWAHCMQSTYNSARHTVKYCLSYCEAIIPFHMLFCPFFIIYSPAILPLGLLWAWVFLQGKWQLCFSLMWKLTGRVLTWVSQFQVSVTWSKKPVSQTKKQPTWTGLENLHWHIYSNTDFPSSPRRCHSNGGTSWCEK